jgi:hypothetical protein
LKRISTLIRRRGRAEKLLLTVLTVGVVGSLAAFGVFSAFSSTSSNTGNSFTAGTVTLSGADNATVGSAFYSVANGSPSTTTTKCLTLKYTGSLPANVRLYRSAFTGGSDAGRKVVDLVITKGSGATDANCTGFTATTTTGDVSSGSLFSFSATDFAGGIVLKNASDSASWSKDDQVQYKIQTALNDTTNAAQGAATGTHDLTFEAQNT